MSPIIAGIAAVFSVAALAFYIIAGVNYYYRGRIFIEGCSWINYQQTTTYYYGYNDYSTDLKQYFGLKGVYQHEDPDLGYNGIYNYDTSSGAFDKCDSSGKGTFGLTVVACIFSFIALITNGIGGCYEAKEVKAVSAVLSFLACLFGIIAVGVFMTICYDNVSDYVEDSNDLYYGNGSILVITALVCNFIAFILAIVNILVGGGHNPLPVPVADK